MRRPNTRDSRPRRPPSPARGEPALHAPSAAPLRFLVHVVPGLEEVAAEEIAELLPGARQIRVWSRFDERTSLLEYDAGESGSVRPWLALGTAEDVFVLAAHARALRSDAGGLAQLAAATLGSRRLDGALRALASMRRSGGAPKTYRVIARKSGEHAFRRTDAGRTVAGAIGGRLRTLRRVEDDADAEFWLTIIGDEALVGLRLSTRRMRGHSREFTSQPASLKPTIARAMVRLSGPREEDVVLDPCCGAGTLLVERGLAFACAALVGGDADPAAVATTRGNARAAGLSVAVRQWDARSLPLEDAGVDVVLCNPPFGKKIEIRGDIDTFYERLVAEIGRVVRPGGRVVLVTSQGEAFTRAARALPSPLVVRRRIPILVRGERAAIYVAESPDVGKEA